MNQTISGENEETLHSGKSGKKAGGKVSLILFFAVFVLGFGAAGVLMLHSTYIKGKACSAETDGIVIDYNRNYKHMYTPIVEYQVGDQMFTSGTNTRSNHRPFKKGESVSIYYNPKNPDEFYLKGYDLKVTYSLGVIFVVFSMGVLTVSVLFAVISRTKMDKERKERILANIFLSAAVLIILTAFLCLAGPGITICILIFMVLFALYGRHQNRRRQ